MKTMARVVLGVVVLWSVTFSALAQQSEPAAVDQIKWQYGPSMARLGTIADVRLPAGYIFADANDTRLLMEIMHNPASGAELGFLALETLEWFLVFEFDNVGYIKDDEQHSLDTEAILKGIRKGNEAANRERAR